MRIGIALDVLNDKSYSRFGEEMYFKLRDHGFSAVDFSLSDTDSVFYTDCDSSKTILAHHRELADDAGIKMHQVHGPWKSLDQGATPESAVILLDQMKRSIEMTAFLGAEYFIIHPIFANGHDDANKPEARMTWEANLKFMRSLVPIAVDNGVTVCLENMPFRSYSISKPSDVYRLVREIDDGNFKMCLDTGHVSVFKLSPADALRECRDVVKTLHVHDNKCNMDLHLDPFFGDIDWSDFGKALKGSSLDGVFSLEVTPPYSMPDDLFDEWGRALCRIANRIVDYMEERQ